MDILKVATNWAEDELISTSFFMIIGLIFLMGSFGFWQFGKTDLERAYIFLTLIAGGFLLIVGIGLFFTNKSRINQFQNAYNENATIFINNELKRTEDTLKEYKTIVFTAIPIIIVACGLIIFFVNTPIWRASMISAIAMLSVILLIDGMAHSRILEYNEKLMEAKSEIR